MEPNQLKTVKIFKPSLKSTSFKIFSGLLILLISLLGYDLIFNQLFSIEIFLTIVLIGFIVYYHYFYIHYNIENSVIKINGLTNETIDIKNIRRIETNMTSKSSFFIPGIMIYYDKLENKFDRYAERIVFPSDEEGFINTILEIKPEIMVKRYDFFGGDKKGSKI